MQVPLEVNSLDQGHAYLLDAGKALYIWQGMKSTLNARSKARWEELSLSVCLSVCLHACV